jgi:deoxyribodipyrimidine photolyase-related protein
MEYNVYCMGSYSDGGNFTSKPYISSSNYLMNMSDWKKDKNNEWVNIWDKLFWEFLNKHKEKIKKIGRLAGLIKYIPIHIK